MSDLRLAPLRCLVATLVATAATAVLARLAVHTLPVLAGPNPTPDAVVAVVATVVGTLAAGRLSLGSALLLLESVLPVGTRVRARVTTAARAVAPGTLRRLVTAGVAIGIGLAGTTGAAAAEPDLAWTVTTGTTSTEETDADDPGVDTQGLGTGDVDAGHTDTGDAGTADDPDDTGRIDPEHTDPGSGPPTEDAGPVLTPDIPWRSAPTPPTTTAPAPPVVPDPGAPVTPTLSDTEADAGSTPPTPGTTPFPPAPAPHPTPGDRVVVAPGDTLWGLTAARLPGAGPAEIAAVWPVVHEANRDVVGADPDLIHPGQVLDLGVLGER